MLTKSNGKYKILKTEGVIVRQNKLFRPIEV